LITENLAPSDESMLSKIHVKTRGVDPPSVDRPLTGIIMQGALASCWLLVATAAGCCWLCGGERERSKNYVQDQPTGQKTQESRGGGRADSQVVRTGRVVVLDVTGEKIAEKNETK
jgi:hypothetical protein